MLPRIAKLAPFGLALIFPAALAQEPEDEPAPEDWSVQVIHLEYANAEEVADLLAQLLPPSVTVAAYYATNSLIIAGDPEALEGADGVAATVAAADAVDRD